MLETHVARQTGWSINRLQFPHRDATQSSVCCLWRWTQISISCEWRDCAGRVSCRLDCFALSPLWGSESSHVQALCLLPWHLCKAHKGSSLLGAALSDHKDVCIFKTALMHKISGIKQRERRQKGVSYRESRTLLCKCFPQPRVGTFCSLPHSHSVFGRCLAIYCKDFLRVLSLKYAFS